MSHDVAILAAFGLLNANDLLRTVDMLDLQPDGLAGTQAAAVAKAEQHAGFEVVLSAEMLDLLRQCGRRDGVSMPQYPFKNAGCFLVVGPASR